MQRQPARTWAQHRCPYAPAAACRPRAARSVPQPRGTTPWHEAVRGGRQEQQRRQELASSDRAIHAVGRFHRGQESSADFSLIREAFGGAALDEMRVARDSPCGRF